jgi:IS30 family transposase
MWRVIAVEDWVEIRRLHRAEGLSIKEIARRLGVARNTVRDALRSQGPPRYERAGAGSAVDAVEPAIIELPREARLIREAASRVVPEGQSSSG